MAASTPACSALFLYMVAFMDTVATIPTGAMAERWKWGSFVMWGFFCGAIYYPLFAAWTWGGGWLAKTWDTMSLGAGYVDFAGSGVVHAVGGVAALAGAIVLGPRIGKFGKDGKPRTLAGHHIPMAMLGTFILLFGWFGFNAASTFAAHRRAVRDGGHQHGDRRCVRRHRGDAVGHQADRQARPRHDGQRHARRPGGDHGAVRVRDAGVATVIGIIAGVLVIEAVWFVERRLKIDDPVGAIAVHGVNGTFGVLAVGHLRQRQLRRRVERLERRGRRRALLRRRFGQLGAQALGAAGHLDRDLRHRLRLLQDPGHRLEGDGQGRHPLGRRPTRSPASTCPRWASTPTPSSRRLSTNSSSSTSTPPMARLESPSAWAD